MRALRTTFLAAVAAAILSLGASPAARADEKADEAADLLRRARVAETVDLDPAKAIELYKRAIDVAGPAEPARDAGLALAALYEARGENALALEALGRVTARFAGRLDDATKRRIHEAMERVLAPGAKATSPLGEVVGKAKPAAPAVVTASPLDAKILGLLARLDDVAPDQRVTVESQVRQALSVVGKEALPTLERAMNVERLDKAQFAAREYARLGETDAVPGLERTIRDGDGFARGAAIDALRSLPQDPATTDATVAAIDRLLALPALAPRRATLRGHLFRFLDDETLLRRHAEGKDGAAEYLQAAVQRGSPGAVERAVGALGKPDAVPSDLLPALVSLAGVKSRGWNGQRWQANQPPDRRMDVKSRVELLRMLAAQPPNSDSVRWVAWIAGALEELADASTSQEAAHRAWGFAMGAGSRRDEAGRELLNVGIGPPLALFEDRDLAAKYWAAFPALWRSTQGWVGQSLLLPRNAVPDAFWEGLLTALPLLSQEERTTVLWAFGGRPLPSPMPESTSARWMEALSLPVGSKGFPAFVYVAAAKSGNPRYAELVRKRLLVPKIQLDDEARGLVVGFGGYTGPDRLPIALELLSREEIANLDVLEDVLRAAKDAPDFWPTVAKALTTLPERGRLGLADQIRKLLGQEALPPKEHDALWGPVLAALPAGFTAEGTWILRTAARAGDPGVARILRDRARSSNQAGPVLPALKEYAGADRLALLLELLPQHGVYQTGWQDYVRRLISDEVARPGGRERLLALARDPQSAASPEAIKRLSQDRERAALLELMTVQEKAAAPASAGHRYALIEAAADLHLREAIPFLLREFQEGWSDEAAKAMDDIRGYHERLARFQDWTQGGEAAKKEVASLLKDADPEVRRAAVLSLAAMGDRESVPALLRVVKEEKDPRVRQAALDAIERLAKSPPPAPPAPEKPSAPAMDGSPR